MANNCFQQLALIHPTPIEFECFASLADEEESVRQSDELREFIRNRRNYRKGDDHSDQDQTGQGQAVRKQTGASETVYITNRFSSTVPFWPSQESYRTPSEYAARQRSRVLSFSRLRSQQANQRQHERMCVHR